MQALYVELEAAMESELVVKVLDILVDIAEIDIQLENKSSAVEILALAMEYPMRSVTYERAMSLFLAIECELCPRVVHDARALAQDLTLEEMVARILSSADQSDF